MRSIIAAVAHSIMPTTPKPRRLPFGLASGKTATIDFRYDLAFYFGLHEPELRSHYQRLVKPGMRCFDIGMYRGWDALTLAVLTQAEVISFDCNPICLDMARRFLEPAHVKVRLVEAVIGDQTSIDDANRRYFAPDFIKMDIEGAEVVALRGAHSTLAEKKPSLIVETHGTAIEAECIDILRSYDYHPLIVYRHGGIFSEARSRADNRWIVCPTPRDQ